MFFTPEMNSKQEFQLRYGRERIKLSLREENLLGVLEPYPAAPLPNPRDACERVLSAPIGSPPLEEICRKGERVAIVVSDITRPAGTHIFLPCLLDRLNACGIRDGEITVIFGLGLHRSQTPSEQEGLLGKEAAGRVRFEDHDARASDLVFIGETSWGTPYFLNRRVAEADRVILTGAVTLHYFAGFGGGRKALLPAVAGFESCVANHLLVLNPGGGGRHPLSRTAQLEGNPVHEDLVEAARMRPPDFILNTVLNSSGELLFVGAGDWEKAHEAGCQFFREHNLVAIREKADLVVLSAGGYPKDLNCVQAHKSLEHAASALRDGGVMIATCECRDGMGDPDFYKWFRHKKLDEFERALREGYEIRGQTAYSWTLKSKNFNIIFISSLRDEEVREMGMTPAASLAEALSLAQEHLGKDYSAYVIPNAASVLPVAERGAPHKAHPAMQERKGA